MFNSLCRGQYSNSWAVSVFQLWSLLLVSIWAAVTDATMQVLLVSLSDFSTVHCIELRWASVLWTQHFTRLRLLIYLSPPNPSHPAAYYDYTIAGLSVLAPGPPAHLVGFITAYGLFTLSGINI